MRLIGRYRDPDNTEKYIFQDDTGTIEITRINTKPDRDIFCVPSMYGCNLGCTFCFLTTLEVSKSNRKVKYSTIERCLQFFDNPKPKRQISIMGVGDPALNLGLVLEACSKEEKVSIATIMPRHLPTLPKNLKIHYSLHSIHDTKRKAMMPSANLSNAEVFDYLRKHEGEKEIHITLIDGVNDTDSDLQILDIYVRAPMWDIPIKFLSFKESGNLKASGRLEEFVSTLSKHTRVEQYNPPGEKIQGSCGMFTKEAYQKGTPPITLEEYTF